MQPIPFARKSNVPGENVLIGQHVDHRAEFLQAMKEKNPQLYAFLARTRPELLHVASYRPPHPVHPAAHAPAHPHAPGFSRPAWGHPHSAPAGWAAEAMHMHDIGDMGATAAAPAANQSWWQSMLTSIGQAIPMGITAYQEIAMAKAQVANAKQGKPPIPVQQYVAASPPTATVQVGLNPSTQKTGLYIAAGAGVLLLVLMMRNQGHKAAPAAAKKAAA